MRATRRRQRTFDPLASAEAVRSLCHRLQERLSSIIPSNEKQLVRFLYAVRHIERYPASETMRGRPSRWAREQLIEAASQLRGLLQRETSGRVSLSSFIGQYLQVLDFPSDVSNALASGQINLQEAALLARLTPERLGCSPAAARSQRRELLESQLTVQGSQTRMRARVKEILGESAELGIPAGGMTSVVFKVDEMLEIDPSDARHIFWEEMKRLFFALREIEPDDLDDDVMAEFLRHMDGISNVLYQIEKKRRERKAQQSVIS